MKITGTPALIGVAASLALAIFGMWLSPVTVEIGKRTDGLMAMTGDVFKAIGSAGALLFIALATITPRVRTQDEDDEEIDRPHRKTQPPEA